MLRSRNLVGMFNAHACTLIVWLSACCLQNSECGSMGGLTQGTHKHPTDPRYINTTSAPQLKPEFFLECGSFPPTSRLLLVHNSSTQHSHQTFSLFSTARTARALSDLTWEKNNNANSWCYRPLSVDFVHNHVHGILEIVMNLAGWDLFNGDGSAEKMTLKNKPSSRRPSDMSRRQSWVYGNVDI